MTRVGGPGWRDLSTWYWRSKGLDVGEGRGSHGLFWGSGDQE